MRLKRSMFDNICFDNDPFSLQWTPQGEKRFEDCVADNLAREGEPAGTYLMEATDVTVHPEPRVHTVRRNYPRLMKFLLSVARRIWRSRKLKLITKFRYAFLINGMWSFVLEYPCIVLYCRIIYIMIKEKPMEEFQSVKLTSFLLWFFYRWRWNLGHSRTAGCSCIVSRRRTALGTSFPSQLLMGSWSSDTTWAQDRPLYEATSVSRWSAFIGLVN